MATVPLPARPDLDQLRTQARELQRAVRSGDPDALQRARLDAAEPRFSLAGAQRLIARHYGFASWPRLKQHVDAISARSWIPGPPAADEPGAFLRLACLNSVSDDSMRRAEARRLYAERPELTGESLAVAAACADVDAVRRHLAADPGAAASPSGPYGWTPLMYAAYARPEADVRAVLDTARLLIEAGADVNDGRFFDGLPTPFTVLTGVLGGGEQEQPPHPHSSAFARLLLDAGAEPNDGQALYNRMFTPDDEFLRLLFEYGLGRGDGGPWRALLPDLLPAPAVLVRRLLAWAVGHDQRARVGLLAAHGVDVSSPLADAGVPLGRGATPLELALENGHRDLAAQLRALGAPDGTGAEPPAVDAVAQFVADALAGDAAAVRAATPQLVAQARAARPALVVWAAGLGRPEAVRLLVATGFDVDALGRADVPVEQPWQTALHTAVERDDAELVSLLLELGADPTIRDQRFDGTPADWAEHLGRPELSALLARPAAGSDG